MAKKPMKTPGAPGGSTRRSPLAPVNGQNTGSGLPGEDFSAREVQKGTLRTRGVPGLGASDGLIGQKGRIARRATTAGAQYRVGMTLPGPQSPEARATQANGRLMTPVMGAKQRQNFDASQQYL